MNEVELKKQMKKRLGEGMMVPAGEGVILACCDLDEYRQSMSIGGFVHQMPIVLHVRGEGAGQYEDWINRYLSLEEAVVLRGLLDFCIISLQKESEVA